MSNAFFLLKGVGGMLLLGAAPIYCVYSLQKMSREGTIRKPDTRRKLEKTFNDSSLFLEKPTERAT